MFQDMIGSYRVIVMEQEQAALRAERARLMAERATPVPVERRWTRMLRVFGPHHVADSRRTDDGNRGARADGECELAGA